MLVIQLRSPPAEKVDDAPDLGQLPVQAGVGGVHHLGPVDRDEQHAVGLGVELEELEVGVVHWGFSEGKKVGGG
jgi:hypothetical protein